MQKINSAESIRGLACLAVVLSHFSLIYYPNLHNFYESDSFGSGFTTWIHHSPFAFFYSGTAAVYIFFVLSGFVLSHAILSKKDINKKILSMSIKRYPRLAIPAVISCILFSIILNTVDINTSNVHWMSWYGAHTNIFEALYQGLIGSFVYGESNLNFVLWTMQVELFASFILFFIIFIFNNAKSYIFHISSLSLPFLLVPISLKIALGAFSFIFGMYLYLFGKHIPKSLTLPALILGLYFAGAHNTSHSYQIFTSIFSDKTYHFLNFLSGFFIVFGILFNKTISNILDKKPLVLLGKLSFSIYLLHTIFLYAISIPLFNILLEFELNYSLSVLITFLISIILIITASFYYSRYVDDLSIKVANKIDETVIDNKYYRLN